jgi:UDP-glucose 4-epimerase
VSTIFITGAHGFIGQHLSSGLARAGHRVCGVGHGTWPESEARASGLVAWHNGDVTPGNLRRLRDTVGAPDLVYHLAGGSSVGAAVANPREDFFRTVATTAELLDWLRLDAPEARVVAISSAAVYGAGHQGPIGEAAPLSPFSPYGHHKRLMEELCRSYAASYGLRSTVARLFSVYGPGLRKQLLWDLCSRLEAGANPLTLGGTGQELRDWTEVRDVVRALTLLGPLASAEVPTFNVGTGTGTAVGAVANLVATAWAGTGRTPVGRAFNGQARPGDPFSLVADPGRLAALGFTWEHPLSRGVESYVRWFRSQR